LVNLISQLLIDSPSLFLLDLNNDVGLDEGKY